MECLTFDGDFCDISMCQEVRGGPHCQGGACSQRRVWERLKAYEDTGLEPGEIEAVAGAEQDGEYIDKQELLEHMKKTNRYFDVKFDIEDFPAADVAPVRHGRWFFKSPNGWACSQCGEWGLMIDNRGICKSSYCPNCGAKMDLED